MKTLLLFIMICLINAWLPGQTINIGTTHYGSRELPFGMYYGFERSASLLLKSEITTFCFITSLGWEVQGGNLESCPVKIYLKQTSSTSLSATTWDLMKDDATLVYDATTNFPATGWQTIDIADFTYWSEDLPTNLLVLCETNYGAIPPLNYPWFYYSLTGTIKKHEFWRSNDLPPTVNGVTDLWRPNIQITYLPISDNNPPSGFMANPVSTSQINLAWIKNSNNDNVMIAYNTTNTFGTPSGAYVPGNSIAGGGTVIYNGSGTSFSQTTGLSPGTIYYYMAWSVISSPLSYSAGTVASATTLCEVTNTFPYTTDFETVTFPPTCWSLDNKTWTRFASASGYGNGTASSKADFRNAGAGNFDLVSPKLDLASMTNPVVQFDHAYATRTTQVDKLELWYSTNDGGTYSLLNTWLGGKDGTLNTGGQVPSDVFVPAPTQWATKSTILPTGTNKIILRGVSVNGNNLYLDNIVFFENGVYVSWNGSRSTDWNNHLNWTPNVIPDEFQIVTIPQTMSNNPTVNLSGLLCEQLTINSGATVTVESSSEITVNGDMIIRNGALLNNNGLVVVKGTLDLQN